jgi:hypothetical protein
LLQHDPSPSFLNSKGWNIFPGFYVSQAVDMLVGVAFHKGRRAAKSRILSDEYIYFLLPNYLTPFLTFCMNSRAFYYGITYDKLFAALVFRSKIALISLLGLINQKNGLS